MLKIPHFKGMDNANSIVSLLCIGWYNRARERRKFMVCDDLEDVDVSNTEDVTRISTEVRLRINHRVNTLSQGTSQ